jgi:hypothetical protein
MLHCRTQFRSIAAAYAEHNSARERCACARSSASVASTEAGFVAVSLVPHSPRHCRERGAWRWRRPAGIRPRSLRSASCAASPRLPLVPRRDATPRRQWLCCALFPHKVPSSRVWPRASVDGPQHPHHPRCCPLPRTQYPSSFPLRSSEDSWRHRPRCLGSRPRGLGVASRPRRRRLRTGRRDFTACAAPSSSLLAPC